MTRRVIFDSNADSPLKISVAGVDAATAEFNACIFDANQPPLRLWGTASVLIAGTTHNQLINGKNISEANPIPVFAAPSGKTSVFMIAWRNQTANTQNLYTPSQRSDLNPINGGGGGGICSNNFLGLCFSAGPAGAPDGFPDNILVNIAVFQNAN